MPVLWDERNWNPLSTKQSQSPNDMNVTQAGPGHGFCHCVQILDVGVRALGLLLGSLTLCRSQDDPQYPSSPSHLHPPRFLGRSAEASLTPLIPLHQGRCIYMTGTLASTTPHHNPSFLYAPFKLFRQTLIITNCQSGDL